MDTATDLTELSPKLGPYAKLTEIAVACSADPLKFVMLAYPWGEEGGPLAKHPGPDEWRIFPDAARKHQCVHSAQRRRECADPFLDLVAKQGARLGRPLDEPR